MASTAAGIRLAQQQRRDQLSIRSRFLAEMLRIWPILDDRRLEQTAPTWLTLMLQLISGYRAESARSAVRYYDQFRAVELPDVPPRRARLADLAEVNEEAIRTSLIVTGPSTIKRQTRRAAALRPSEALESLVGSPPVPRQYQPERIRKAALVQVSGAASRHVLDGGREAIEEAILDDDRAVGFFRVVDGDPCWFCAMLASRGAVYPTRRAALKTSARSKRGEEQTYHDGCGCTAEPAFSESQDWPGKGREYQELWNRVTAGKSGRDARIAFRRAIEGREAA